MKRVFFLTLIAAITFCSSIYAQPKSSIVLNPKRLPVGISESVARKLMASSDASSAKANNELSQQRQSQLKKIESSSADERGVFGKMMASDPIYKKYQDEFQAIIKGRKSPQDMIVALRALADKYRKFFDDIKKRSAINEITYHSKISKLYNIGRYTDLFGLIGRETSEPSEPAAPSDFTLSAPYPVYGTRTSLAGISIMDADATADSSNGKLYAFAQGIHGGSGVGATASVGHYIKVPAGYSKVEITVVMRVRYNLLAIAGIGAAGGWCDAILEVEGSNGTVVRKVRNLGVVVAPVIFYAETTGDEEIVISKKFNVSSQGGDFQVKASASSNAYAALLGGANAHNNSQVREIRVKYIR